MLAISIVEDARERPARAITQVLDAYTMPVKALLDGGSLVYINIYIYIYSQKLARSIEQPWYMGDTHSYHDKDKGSTGMRGSERVVRLHCCVLDAA